MRDGALRLRRHRPLPPQHLQLPAPTAPLLGEDIYEHVLELVGGLDLAGELELVHELDLLHLNASTLEPMNS